jgi:flagellar basal-body rod modification protein FlgD
MATTSNVSSISGAEYFGQTAATKKGELDMSTFLNLLVTQLQNQNPLEPMDDAAFYGQMAQLGQVQGMEKLNASSDLNQAQQLLGKTVTATRPTSSEAGKQGEPFTGTVSKIVFKNGQQYLNVQEDKGGEVQIQLGSIQNVLPSVDVAGASNLIGRKVAGTASVNNAAVSVVGTVEGISAENGQAVAQVRMDGKIYSVPVPTLTQIAQQ